jgi:hypothetical protein
LRLGVEFPLGLEQADFLATLIALPANTQRLPPILVVFPLAGV